MFKLMIVLVIVAGAYAALELYSLEEKPDKYKDQQGCYIEELDTVIPFGQSRPSKKQCKEYRCSEDIVTIASCGVASVVPPCILTTDKTKAYPCCCPRPYCP